VMKAVLVVKLFDESKDNDIISKTSPG